MIRLKALGFFLVMLFSLPISAHAADNYYITLGDYNADVIALHEKLIELGYYDLRPESPFGQQSMEAVRRLQENLGDEQTGLIATQDEFEEILSLDHVIGRNLIENYTEIIQSNPYLISETLEGQSILHVDCRYSEDDNYIDVINFVDVIEPDPGKEYTLSFMAKGIGELHTYFYPEAVSVGSSNMGASTWFVDGHMTSELSEDWKQYIFTWRVSSNVTGSKSIIPARIFKGTDVWISKIKLEKGNMSTEWILPET